MAGASPSVIRAGIMAITNIVLNLLLKKNNPIYTLSFSVFLITLFNPISIENVGLILSVFGTMGIVLLSNDLNLFLGQYVKNKILLETISVTLSAQIFLMPIMAYYFNTISFISFFSNLIIVPIAEGLSVIGLISFGISLFSISLAKLLAVVPYLIVKYIIISTKICSRFSFLNLVIPTPKIWMLVIFYIFLFFEWKIYKLKYEIVDMSYEIKCVNYIKNRFYIVALVIVIISFIITKIPKTYDTLTAIDVGQGDSFLITTSARKHILIDGGGSENGTYDVGKNVLLPYLLDNWITKLDAIFVSHAHADHIEGVYTLIENLDVKQVFISTYNKDNEYIIYLKELCAKHHVDIIEVFEEDTIVIDDIKIKVLYPNKDTCDRNENNLSMLLKVFIKDTTILFTGDLEKDIEAKVDFDVTANILKVAHHGSKTSTTSEFLAKVKPQISIISVAKDNSFGHPNLEVVERLKKISKVLMTKDLGEITLKIYEKNVIEILGHVKNE